MIEIKYYSWFQSTKELDLADEIAIKARDVLAMLLSGGANDKSGNIPGKLSVGELWQHAKMMTRIRVVLHCELPASPSKLFPGIKDAANILAKLRDTVRAIDPHPIVMSRSDPVAVPWTVS